MKPNSKDDCSFDKWYAIVLDISRVEGISRSKVKKKIWLERYESGQTAIDAYMELLDL